MIWAVVGLIILGIVIGGYYISQKNEGSKNLDETTNTPEIPGEALNGMFDALEEGLNQNE